MNIEHKAALCFLLTSSLFIFVPDALYAKSDLQADVGFRAAEVSFEDGHTGRKVDVTDTMYGMSVGFTNYNAWKIGRRGFISLGFMDSVSVSFSEHDATGVTGIIGPAFVAEMGRVLSFECAACLSLGILRVEPGLGYSDNSMTKGFALDARVCFMPEMRAGPLVGVRYEYSKIDDLFFRDIDRGAFTFYAGAAIRLSN